MTDWRNEWMNEWQHSNMKNTLATVCPTEVHIYKQILFLINNGY